eukprot:TRINITY_DN5518_c0_g1_i1.p1 TRINITY_DN5518_c0_g1~~TRINITY_DN5518_c0_g1_i1.p1  ORF type:complete len:487 (-),score=65.32 TRINITY_DN5518_c0_g1_i1:116-1576(-)
MVCLNKRPENHFRCPYFHPPYERVLFPKKVFGQQSICVNFIWGRPCKKQGQTKACPRHHWLPAEELVFRATGVLPSTPFQTPFSRPVRAKLYSDKPKQMVSNYIEMMDKEVSEHLTALLNGEPVQVGLHRHKPRSNLVEGEAASCTPDLQAEPDSENQTTVPRIDQNSMSMEGVDDGEGENHRERNPDEEEKERKQKEERLASRVFGEEHFTQETLEFFLDMTVSTALAALERLSHLKEEDIVGSKAELIYETLVRFEQLKQVRPQPPESYHSSPTLQKKMEVLVFNNICRTQDFCELSLRYLDQLPWNKMERLKGRLADLMHDRTLHTRDRQTYVIEMLRRLVEGEMEIDALRVMPPPVVTVDTKRMIRRSRSKSPVMRARTRSSRSRSRSPIRALPRRSRSRSADRKSKAIKAKTRSKSKSPLARSNSPLVRKSRSRSPVPVRRRSRSNSKSLSRSRSPVKRRVLSSSPPHRRRTSRSRSRSLE